MKGNILQGNRNKAGPYAGTIDDDCVVWRGIRYASAQRFALPEPLPAPATPIHCNTFGPPAAQAANPTAKAGLAEDVLFLNVYSPAADDARRPVMVWIHGGAFEAGTASFYNGARLAREGDIVVVTISYRLGILGFADFSDLGIPRNLGLHDQIAALQWIKHNIAAFGGDPDQVTIAGESAGSTSVALLMVAKATQGLFHKAIMQSGGLSLAHEASHAARIAERYRELLGSGAADADALRGVAIERLMALQKQVAGENPGGLASAPILDGDLLPPSLDMAVNKSTPAIPLLAGSNREEIRFFELPPFRSIITQARHAILERIEARFGKSVSRRVASAYPDTKSGNRELATDANFGQPTRNFAERHAAQGHGTWVYRFDAPGIIGAAHGVELAFIWPLEGLFALLLRGGFALGKRKRLAVRMRHYWIEFIRNGNPGDNWSRYEPKNRQLKIFNWRDTIEEKANDAARTAWDGLEINASQSLRVPTIT